MVKRKVDNQLPNMLLLFGVGLLAGVLATSFLIEKSVDNLSQQTTGQFALVRDSSMQRSPTECDGLDSCDDAKANGGLAAVSSASLGNYTNYSFAIVKNARISSVVVRVDAFADSNAARMSVAVSDNAGVSWANAHVITPRFLRESSHSIDVTADKVWSIAKLNNQQLWVKVKCYSSDDTEVTCNLDWIPVTVRYR